MEKVILQELSFNYGYLKKINNKKLINYILKEGKPASLEETDSVHEDIVFSMHDELQKIFVGITKQLNQSFVVTRFWSQIHLPNHSTNVHDHLVRENMTLSPDYSGVYYLQCDEKSGYFCFQYKKDGVNYSRWKIKPEVGKFILFPSHLEHFVSRNYSQKKRIALSFNFNIEKIN